MSEHLSSAHRNTVNHIFATPRAVLHRPHDKDVSEQTIVDLRRLLTQAGLAPDGPPAVPDERDRDFGDSRWGKPN